jgi:hypothetical protein
LQALLPETLEDLLGAQVMRFQPGFNPGLVGIEFAGAVGALGLVVIVPQPMPDGFFVQLKLRRDLPDAQFLFLAQGTNLAISGVVDHGWPPV